MGEVPSNRALVRRLLGLGWRYRAGCILILVQQSFLVLLNLCGLGLIGLGIDYIRYQLEPNSSLPHWPFGMAPGNSSDPILVTAAIAIAVLVTAIFQAILRFCATVSAGMVVQRIVIDLRSTVYDQLQRLSFRFFDAHKTGSIINRVAGDVQSVRMFVDGVVVQVLAIILSLSIYLAYMFRVHIPLTLACLATTPLLWIGAVVFSRLVKPAYLRNSQLVDDLILTLSENVQGVNVVKGFNREPEEIVKFDAANRAVRDQKHAIFWRVSILQPLMGFMTQLNMLVLLGYGSFLVIRGEIRLGEGLFVFANLLHQFANQVGQITNIANTIQSSLTGAQRVFEVLDMPAEIDSPSNAVRLLKVQGNLRFEGVTFAYGDRPALTDISLDIKAGECIAIVGAVGAGKSTLLSLIPRFYDPTQGRVCLDGYDLRSLRVNNLRRNIGMVFQDSFLFSTTVAANIAFGCPDASPEQIERAARVACAHEFICKLSHGYKTVIGEYGCNLSGGQRQRLAIARAILLEPPILILDDATAAVDPETEEQILKAMENAMRGRTTLVTAHRLSSLRRADRVVVLENGHIQQIGSHASLMRQPGHYRQAALLQTATGLEEE